MSVNKEIEGNPKVFEYADLHLKCGACGEDAVVFENVKGGLRVDLYTTDQHKLTLKCDKCGAEMELYYTEAINPPVEEDKKDEESQIEKVQSETEKENEPTKEEIEEFVEELQEELEKIDEKLDSLDEDPQMGNEVMTEELQDEQIPEKSKTEE